MLTLDASGASRSYKMIGSFPNVTGKANVYRITSPNIDAARLQSIFGIKGQKSHYKDGCQVYQDGGKTLEIYNTGAFRYMDEPEFMADKNSKLPSEEEAIKIAQQFLIENSLLPENTFIEGVFVNEGYIQARSSTEETIRLTPHMLVSFGIKIDGQKVYGPGAKISVYIGDEGKIVCCYKAWKKITLLKNQNIATPQKALEQFKGKGVVNYYRVGIGEAVQEVNIKSITLTYWAAPGPENQQFLEPVYILEDVYKGASEEGKFLWKEPALL